MMMDPQDERHSRNLRPRVLVMSRGAYSRGGMERVMQTLGRDLPRAGFRPQVLIPDSEASDEICEWFIENGSSCEPSKLLASLNSFNVKNLVRLARDLRRRELDLVNIHSPGDFIPRMELLAARLAGLPAVVSIHGSARRTRPISRRGRLTNWLCWSRFTSAIVAPTLLVQREQKASGIASKNIHLVRYGVAAAASQLDRTAARQRLGLSPDILVVTTFGRLVRDKGVDVLIGAIDLLPTELLERTLFLIGGVGDQQVALRRLITDRTVRSIRFLEHVDDTGSYYAASDFFALPSRHEPFGLVFVEAAHCGIPSIGTNVGGIPEAIIAGETGLLVESEQPQRLAESITLLAGDPALRARLGRAAQVRARSQFSDGAMVAGYSNIFTAVLGL